MAGNEVVMDTTGNALKLHFMAQLPQISLHPKNRRS